MVGQFRKGHTKAAKLTGELVLEIRQRYINGETQGALARAFHLSVGQIGRIVRNECWHQVAQQEDPQAIRDGAADSLARLQQMQSAPLPIEEQEALERGQKLVERMGLQVITKIEAEKSLEELAAEQSKNPYY